MADETRKAKEPMRPDHRDRFRSNAFGARMLEPGARAAVLSSSPPTDLLATFIWLFPDAEVSAERRQLWRFNLARLQAGMEVRQERGGGLQSLLEELQASGQSVRLLDEARRGLDQLGARAGSAVKSAKLGGYRGN